MIKIKLNVTYQDGRTADVVAGPATQVAFEREFKIGVPDLVEAEKGEDGQVRDVHFKTEHIYWLAWHASKSGVEFDAWLESLDSVDFDVEAANPTQSAASESP